MKLQHIKTLPAQNDKFLRTEWAIYNKGKKIYELTHEYPAVQTPIISFKQSLRRKAMQVVHGLGMVCSVEDLTIVDPATDPVDMVEYASNILGY